MPNVSGAWAEVARRAEAQHGVVSVDDLLFAGMSTYQVSEEVRRGRLVAMGRGSYRVAGVRLTFESRVLGVIAVHGPSTWASHRTAAALWGVPGFPEDHRIELLRPVDGSNQRRGARVHRSSAIPPHHVTRHRGVPVTSVSRTTFDLAGTIGPVRLERAVGEVVRRELTTDSSLRIMVAELGCRGRPGTRQLRRVLEDRGAGPVGTALEDLARAVIVAAGLPEPEWQVDISDAEGWIGCVDGLFRSAGVILELDSREWHAQPTDVAHDARRDRRCAAAGYLVLRLRWSDLTQRPEAVVAHLRTLLDARAA